MAEFCAQIDVAYNCQDKNDLIQKILFKGHRGYISLEEKVLAKKFDNLLMQIRDKYTALKKTDDESKDRRHYRESTEFTEVKLFYEEGVSIANEVFEEEFLK